MVRSTQAQPPEVFCKSLLRNATATLLKKRPRHKYFPVNFAKFLRTLFSEFFLVFSEAKEKYLS